MKKKFYITTPLYYPSGGWHLGHAYTTVCCDAVARFKRMEGCDVFYLTGTDEHGQKIEQRAAAAGQTPREFVDGLVADIQRLWRLLDISYDKFIRTTDETHVDSVQRIFTRLYEQGDIYKSVYKGKYCTPCEAFWTETQLNGGKCPDCGREVTDSEEECYFFRLSKYQDRVKALLTETDFLQPPSRVNEMVNNFLNEGLSDLAVSRTSVKWGIPVPFDPKHVVYVWIDALSNYINALGYNAGGENMAYWPADVHMVGKEIVRFHAIIWPALLMALELPLPRRVYGHGWLLFSGDKMSKSKGNVADPFLLAERYGIDALRYYLLREIPFGADGVYTDEAFLTRYNSDLVNDLGNLTKRTVAMARQYLGGKVRRSGAQNELTLMTDALYGKISADIDKLSCSKALENVFALVGRANKFIDEQKPWFLNKDGRTDELEAVLYALLESIRVIATSLLPFITVGPKEIFAQLGRPVPSAFDDMRWGVADGYSVDEDKILYPRVDVKKELSVLAGEAPETAAAHITKKTEKREAENMEETITIDDFFKTQLRVALVTACEKVEKTDKLLKLTLKVGEETRTVVSGIARNYNPEEMIGKRVVLVANLKPVKLRGIESQGMVLCAVDGDKVVLVSPEGAVADGSEIS